MPERRVRQNNMLSPEREELFRAAKAKLQFPVEVYRLGDRFEGLSRELAPITMLDVTKGPGCHYGVRNVFVPIIHHLESTRNVDGKSKIVVSPEKTILVEPSTGNGWVAFSDAAYALGYEHIVIMPEGLPEPRYKHPQRREVTIIRTPKEEYAEGMPEKLKELMKENSQRRRHGEKVYVSPNHAVAGADITVEAMSEVGRQLLENLGELDQTLRVVLSMGNGSSLCAVGEYVKKYSPGAKVVATESLAYGGGYEYFSALRRRTSYRELFGVDTADPRLMAHFSAYGTNAPIGIEMPLQIRAMSGDLIDDYVLFTDDAVLQAYQDLKPNESYLRNVLGLSNFSLLPQTLYDVYGNSTLANIAIAGRFTGRDERIVAMAYDGRKNY